MIGVNFLLKFVVLFLLLLSLRKVVGEFCRLPANEKGICKLLNDCDVLKRLIPLARQHEYYRSYLIKTQCKVDHAPWVCCPLDDDLNLSSRIEKTFQTELPKAKSGLCGKSYNFKNTENRIVGGDETVIGEFPWNALLIYEKPFQRKGYNCGGTLISSMHVITAAHCTSKLVIPTTWNITNVRFGEKDLSAESDCQNIDNVFTCARPPVDIKVDKIFVHEYYNGQQGNPYDISIIKLDQMVKFTEFVRPICLPLDKVVNTEYGVTIATGFGATENQPASDVLLKAEIDIVNHYECRTKYETVGRSIYSSQICAIGNHSDTCKGDSGGGLYKYDDGDRVFYLIGITSYGPKRCMNEFPGIYIKIQYFIEWIKAKISDE